MAKKKAAKKKAAPSKKCPKCGAEHHVATRKCDCGHAFTFKKKAAKKKVAKKKVAPPAKHQEETTEEPKLTYGQERLLDAAELLDRFHGNARAAKEAIDTIALIKGKA